VMCVMASLMSLQTKPLQRIAPASHGTCEALRFAKVLDRVFGTAIV